MKQLTCAVALAVALPGARQTAEETPGDAISMPPWAESGPKAADYFRVYPIVARRVGIEPDVRLACAVRDDRKLDCKSSQEAYPGYGFDVAALAVSNLFVVKRLDDPTIQPGKQVILPISFKLVE